MAKRTILDVLYADGTEASIPVRPIGIVAAERKYGGGDKMPAVEATLFAAWHGIQGDKPTFDAWVQTLEAIEERSADAPLGNTASEASAPSSSSSPPEPE